MRIPVLCLLVVFLLGQARAAEPFFKKNDVVALVGGEDMVVASEDGYLELFVTRALPDYHIHFRDLAWEGDTVYEQRRDLNFPSWEEQLDKIGATVVLCQFGQMESLAGKDKIPEFIAAYEQLLERLSAGGKRRIVVIAPNCYDPNGGDATPSVPYRKLPYHLTLRPWDERIAVFFEYVRASDDLAAKHHWGFLDWYSAQVSFGVREQIGYEELTRDGVHMSEPAHKFFGAWLAGMIKAGEIDYHGTFERYIQSKKDEEKDRLLQQIATAMDGVFQTIHQGLEFEKKDHQLRQLIVAKSKLWFNYWRAQNWAFLAGDRTNQPSSRDWRDPSKRWFPAEREEFLPLMNAKEKEIGALGATLR